MHTTRLVAATALAATALAATTTALLIAGPAGAATAPAAAAPAAAALAAAAPAPAAAAAPAPAVAAAPGSFGPYGYGGVKLGMTAQQAKATGKIVLKWRDYCSGWDYKARPTPRDEVSLYISKKLGVAVVFAPRGARTPEGIAVGSTLHQVQKAYPKVKKEISGYYATVPGNRKAYYYFGVDQRNKVQTLVIGRYGQDCVN
ncbi:hypothetical protein [Nonomuraea rhodomycinica]|uniref:hypothetical protein n=1 Tax=Nonomuraea rhodomycinica TaxID=1712872 RepID=UPI00158BDDE5|nr:hypothetical protein [Nonomuraea rhodomycinica]